RERRGRDVPEDRGPPRRVVARDRTVRPLPRRHRQERQLRRVEQRLDRPAEVALARLVRDLELLGLHPTPPLRSRSAARRRTSFRIPWSVRASRLTAGALALAATTVGALGSAGRGAPASTTPAGSGTRRAVTTGAGVGGVSTGREAAGPGRGAPVRT